MPELLGTLLPLTALKNEVKDGDLFSAGKRFVDWLEKTGQNAWQVLPLHQTYWQNLNLFDSPYSSYGIGLNPMYLDPEVRISGVKLLRSEELQKFEKENKYWLDDYAFFLALAEYFETESWMNWPVEIRNRKVDAMSKWQKKLIDRIIFFKRQQFVLHLKWKELKDYANSKGIKLIGDLPFYLPLNSPLVWRYKECFELESEYVAGVKKHDRSIRQVWSSPLYMWTKIKVSNEIFDLWKMRMKYLSNWFDWVRIDSVVSFYEYGMLSKFTLDRDKVVCGPGDLILIPLLKFVRQSNMNIFMEDISGFDMSKLHVTMTKYKIPGLSVFTLGIRKDDSSIYEDYFNFNLYSSNHFYYTSNHDALPLLKYFLEMSESQKQIILENFDLDLSASASKNAKIVRKYLYKKCKRLIIPLQDWLLTTEQINMPGTKDSHNWSYQISMPVKDFPIKFSFLDS